MSIKLWTTFLFFALPTSFPFPFYFRHVEILSFFHFLSTFFPETKFSASFLKTG